MSNHSFNEVVVPLLQPDPDRPGSTVDRRGRVRDAMTPRRDDPQTGFSLARATGSAELREMLDLDATSSSSAS